MPNIVLVILLYFGGNPEPAHIDGGHFNSVQECKVQADQLALDLAASIKKGLQMGVSKATVMCEDQTTVKPANPS